MSTRTSDRDWWAWGGEDVIAYQILHAVNDIEKVAVDIGAAGLRKSNTRGFAARGWKVFYFDKEPQLPDVIKAHITAENVEDTLVKAGVPKSFSFLSIDVDGNDYWIWKAITSYKPRIVVIEFNRRLPADRKLVQPYDPNYVWDRGSLFFGASFAAMESLAIQKGYRFIGDFAQHNLMFISNDYRRPGNYKTIVPPSSFVELE